MRPASIIRRNAPGMAFFWILLLQGGALAGQTTGYRRDFDGGIRSGVGYTAVMPDAMVGVGAWHLFGSGRFGMFADAKTSFPDLRDDGDYCPAEIGSCTVADIEANRIEVKIRDVDQYLIFNVGAMITLGPELAFLLGVGPVRHARFREFSDLANDPGFTITDDGTYWAPHESTPQWGTQAVLGLLMRLGSRIVVRFGYETSPGGMSAGGYWVFSD